MLRYGLGLLLEGELLLIVDGEVHLGPKLAIRRDRSGQIILIFLLKGNLVSLHLLLVFKLLGWNREILRILRRYLLVRELLHLVLVGWQVVLVHKGLLIHYHLILLNLLLLHQHLLD